MHVGQGRDQPCHRGGDRRCPRVEAARVRRRCARVAARSAVPATSRCADPSSRPSGGTTKARTAPPHPVGGFPSWRSLAESQGRTVVVLRRRERTPARAERHGTLLTGVAFQRVTRRDGSLDLHRAFHQPPRPLRQPAGPVRRSLPPSERRPNNSSTSSAGNLLRISSGSRSRIPDGVACGLWDEEAKDYRSIQPGQLV